MEELQKDFDNFLLDAQIKGYSLKTIMGWLRQRVIIEGESIPLDADVSVKTAEDLILYLEAKLIVDDDLLYGNKRNKEYFITGCYDNQEMIAQTSIKVYAKDFEEGTVVRIYLPNR
jgi:hypothetical protein